MENRILSSRYRIVKALGQGGFGKTYLARDTQRPSEPFCVVKQLYPVSHQQDVLVIARRLFKKEAEILEKVGIHPQIPRLLAYFEEEEEFYLVQEYIQGKTLTQELASSEPWDEQQVIRFLWNCLEILAFIHSQGVIHRDVKPDNLIRSQNNFVLVDFGSVKEIAIAKTQLMTSTIAIGTRGYMPTEQATGKPRFSSDIYALGMIAIQALTGNHPLNLEEDEKGEIIWQGKCRPQLNEIVTRMTRYHFKDRYQSATEVLKQLNILEPQLEITSNSNLTTNFDVDNQTSILKTNIDKFTALPEVRDEVNNLPEINSSENKVSPEDTLVEPASTTFSSSDNQETFIPQAESSPSHKTNNPNLVTKHKAKFNTKKSVVFATCLGVVSFTAFILINHSQNKNRDDKVIVQTLETQYRSGNYQECYDLVNKSLNQDHKLSAQTSEQWTGKCGLEVARQKAADREYIAALDIAKQLPQDNNQELTENINLWSEKVLELAEQKYIQEGNLAEAKTIILSTIPENSTVKSKALAKQQQWEQEHLANQAAIESANQALREKRWQDAKNETTKLSNPTTALQLETKRIIMEADRGIEQAQNSQTSSEESNTDSVRTIDLCQDAVELCNQ